jgi:hypothetical protein
MAGYLLFLLCWIHVDVCLAGEVVVRVCCVCLTPCINAAWLLPDVGTSAYLRRTGSPSDMKFWLSKAELTVI